MADALASAATAEPPDDAAEAEQTEAGTYGNQQYDRDEDDGAKAIASCTDGDRPARMCRSFSDRHRPGLSGNAGAASFPMPP